METTFDITDNEVENIEEERVIIHSASHSNIEEIKYLIKKKCNINGLGSYGVPKKIIDYLYFKDKYIRLTMKQKVEIRWCPFYNYSNNNRNLNCPYYYTTRADGGRYKMPYTLLWGRYANRRDISIYENINIKQFNPQKLKEYSSKELKESLKINKVRGRSNLTNKKKMIKALLKI